MRKVMPAGAATTLRLDAGEPWRRPRRLGRMDMHVLMAV